MDLTTGFFLYAVAFRLAIIAVGLISIVLGYKLFVQGVMGGGRTDAEAQLGDIKLTIKNAAPGTCFALFGVVIIVVMLMQGSPELTLKSVEKVADLEQELASGSLDEVATAARYYELALKSGGAGRSAIAAREFAELTEQAAGDLQAGRDQDALETYSKALEVRGLTTEQAAVALNQLALLYHDRGRLERAETLARMAVLFAPAEAGHHATLALSLEAAGKAREAVEAMTRAVALDEAYTDKLERMKARAQ